MEKQYTPGPWSAETEPGFVNAKYPLSRWNPSKLVASVYPCRYRDPDESSYRYFGDDEELQLANARLIASAPALVEALEELVNHDHRFMTPELVDKITKARSALKSALGE